MNIAKLYIKYRNIVSVSLTKNFTPYEKNISTKQEKSFGYSENNFPPLHIVDNKESISKSSYEEAMLKNEFFENKNLAANEKAADNNQDLKQALPQNSNSIATTEPNETVSNDDSGLVSKVVNTAKTW